MCFEDALRLTQFDEALKIDFGYILTDAGEYRRAQKIFTEAIEVGLHPKRAHLGLLICFLGQDQTAEAMRFAEEVMLQFPEDRELHEQINQLIRD